MTGRRRQFGQGMVEYTIVTSLGILVLLGPGADVISWTMSVIKNNYQGYSYAMSLSQWPEFDIRSATPIEIASGWDPTGQGKLGDTGTRGSNIPVYTPPDTRVEDFFVNNYRVWLAPRVGEERATLLAGPDISDQVGRISDFYNSALDTVDNLSPDALGDAINDILPPDFSEILGMFP
jgi:hypothetical protein